MTVDKKMTNYTSVLSYIYRLLIDANEAILSKADYNLEKGLLSSSLFMSRPDKSLHADILQLAKPRYDSAYPLLGGLELRSKEAAQGKKSEREYLFAC